MCVAVAGNNNGVQVDPANFFGTLDLACTNGQFSVTGTNANTPVTNIFCPQGGVCGNIG